MVVHAHYPIGEPRVEREAETLVQNGYDVDVICLKHASELSTEEIAGVTIYRLPVRRHKTSGVVVQFFEYLTFLILVAIRFMRPSARYDVVHVHNLPDFLVFSAIVPRLRGARIILDLHDLMPEFYLSRFQSNKTHWLVSLVKLQEKLSCRFAHHIITVTEDWRQTLISRGVPANKCSVIMNVAGSRFEKGASNLRQGAPKNGDFHLFYHGTLAHRYGVDFILQTMANLNNELPNLRCTIHGKGEYLETLMNLADELKLGDTVTFSTEYIPIDDLPKLISSASVGVVPYRNDVFTNGILPTKLMEYVFLGIPAIVVRTPTIKSYFDDSMVQFFTGGDVDELGDCIRRLYHNPDQRAVLAKNARRFNQKYNWKSQEAHLVNLAEHLTNWPSLSSQVN